MSKKQSFFDDFHFAVAEGLECEDVFLLAYLVEGWVGGGVPMSRVELLFSM